MPFLGGPLTFAMTGDTLSSYISYAASTVTGSVDSLWAGMTAIATVLTLAAAVWSTWLSRRDAQEARAELSRQLQDQMMQDLSRVVGYWEALDDRSTANSLRIVYIIHNGSRQPIFD